MKKVLMVILLSLLVSGCVGVGEGIPPTPGPSVAGADEVVTVWTTTCRGGRVQRAGPWGGGTCYPSIEILVSSEFPGYEIVALQGRGGLVEVFLRRKGK